MDTSQFAIKITWSPKEGYQIAPAMVADERKRTWDGAWYTRHELDKVKVFNTQIKAERWIAARPMLSGAAWRHSTKKQDIFASVVPWKGAVAAIHDGYPNKIVNDLFPMLK